MEECERLSEDELAYHFQVIEQLGQAQTVFQSWAAHLARKYQIGPLDSIDRAGNIVRQKVETEKEGIAECH